MTNPLAQDLGGVEAFCDAMEREHGSRPKFLSNGVLLNGRDQDRYEGWMLAMGGRSPERDAHRYRLLRNAPNNAPDNGVEILFWRKGKGTVTSGRDLDIAVDNLLKGSMKKTASYQEGS